MKIKTITIATLFVAGTSLAIADDLSQKEIDSLVEQGVLKSSEVLNQEVSNLHPDSNIKRSDIDHDDGQYIYEVELLDKNGVEWDVELDATSGEVLKNEQDE